MEYKKCVYDHIVDCSKGYENNVSVEYYGKNWTYKELEENVTEIIKGLVSLGVNPGDKVSVCSLNTPESVFIMCALNKIGAIICPIDAHSNASSINYYANEAKSKYLYINDVSYESAKQGINDTNIEHVIISAVNDNEEYKNAKYDDKFIKYEDLYSLGKNIDLPKEFDFDINRPAIYMPTGGTTGVSKIVAITNEGMINANENYKQAINFPAGARYMTFLPWMIVSGLNANLFLPLCCAETACLCLSYSPEDFVKNVIRTKPDTIVAAPVYWIKLASALRTGEIKKEDLHFMENPISAGDYTYPEVEKSCNEVLPFKLKKAYALTESTSCGLITSNENNIIGSMGRPAGNLKIKLINPNMKDDELEVGANEEGHIYLYGSTVASYYVDNPEETEITFGVDKNGERFVRTGDIGIKDENDNYYFIGRIKRMILRKGYNIFPSTIEWVITKHPAVLNCAVVGVDHLEDGEVPVAHIVLKEEYQFMEEEIKQQIQQMVETSVPFYFQPEEYYIDSSLPVTKRAKKIDYAALKLMNNKNN